MAPCHLVVVPLPVYGHIFPVLHLSLRLASLGNKITFITSERTKASTLWSYESALSQTEDHEQAERASISLNFLPDEDQLELLQQGSEQGFVANMVWMASQVEAVDKIIESSVARYGPVRCVILDFLLYGSLKEVAKKTGATVAVFWTASAAWLLLSLQVNFLVDGGFVPLTSSNAQLIVSGITGIPPLCNYKDVPGCLLRPVIDGQIQGIGMAVAAFKQAAFVLTNTISGLDSEDHLLECIRQFGVNVVQLGPLLPLPVQNESSTRAPNDLPVLSWLDRQPTKSVLYISFGTLAENSLEQLQELAGALEQLVEQRFVWVLRQSQQCLSQDFAKRTSGRGMVIPWCSSQLQLLSHSSIGGFLSHCGWNSILESLSCGVPMIGWPCIGEQNLNAKFLVDVWKVGSQIVPWNTDGSSRLVDRLEISRAITHFLDDQCEHGKEMRQEARKFQKAAEECAKSSVVETKVWVESLRILTRP